MMNISKILVMNELFSPAHAIEKGTPKRPSLLGRRVDNRKHRMFYEKKNENIETTRNHTRDYLARPKLEFDRPAVGCIFRVSRVRK